MVQPARQQIQFFFGQVSPIPQQPHAESDFTSHSIPIAIFGHPAVIVVIGPAFWIGCHCVWLVVGWLQVGNLVGHLNMTVIGCALEHLFPSITESAVGDLFCRADLCARVAAHLLVNSVNRGITK